MEGTLLTGVAILLFVSAIILGIRNGKVYKHRTKISDAVYKTGIEELEDGSYSLAKSAQRWAYVREISYDKQVLMFWKPLESFYDQEFLKEIGVK